MASREPASDQLVDYKKSAKVRKILSDWMFVYDVVLRYTY